MTEKRMKEQRRMKKSNRNFQELYDVVESMSDDELDLLLSFLKNHGYNGSRNDFVDDVADAQMEWIQTGGDWRASTRKSKVKKYQDYDEEDLNPDWLEGVEREAWIENIKRHGRTVGIDGVEFEMEYGNGLADYFVLYDHGYDFIYLQSPEHRRLLGHEPKWMLSNHEEEVFANDLYELTDALRRFKIQNDATKAVRKSASKSFNDQVMEIRNRNNGRA